MSADHGQSRLRQNAAYQAIVAELNLLRIPHTVEWGGNHPKVVFTFRGIEMKKPFSMHPKVHVAKKAGADIRRMIAQVKREGEPERPAATAEAAPASPSRGQESSGTPESSTTDAGGENRLPVVRLADGAPVADSRDVAAFFGRRHGDVLRAIRDVECSDEFRRRNFASFKNNDLTGESTSHVTMTKDGFVLVVMGFTGAKAVQFKEAYIAQFNAMEAELKNSARADVGTVTDLSPDAAAAIGGIVKVVVRKALEEIAAGNGLILDGVGALLSRAPQGGAVEPVGETVTAHEVVADMAEVPPAKLFRGLSGQIAARLSRFCARHGFMVRMLDTRPGEKLVFPRQAAVEWLAGGGRAEIWALVTSHGDRAAGQGRLRLVGEQRPAAPA